MTSFVFESFSAFFLVRVECGVRGGVRISWGWFKGMAYPDRVSGRARDGLEFTYYSSNLLISNFHSGGGFGKKE